MSTLITPRIITGSLIANQSLARYAATRSTGTYRKNSSAMQSPSTQQVTQPQQHHVAGTIIAAVDPIVAAPDRVPAQFLEPWHRDHQIEKRCAITQQLMHPHIGLGCCNATQVTTVAILDADVAGLLPLIAF